MNILRSCRILALWCGVLSFSTLIEGGASPAQAATTTCSYNFTVRSTHSFLRYCVTENGNIQAIETPAGHRHLGQSGEGYGVCQESPAIEYHDYATEDSGNWNPAVMVSHTSSSVKIARTTSDGHWTLTQTISKSSGPPSIKVVMALKNNRDVAATAYLVRYADVAPDGIVVSHMGATANMAFGFYHDPDDPPPRYGLLLENAGKQTFGYWQSLYQDGGVGPNPCAWAFRGRQGFGEYVIFGGLIMAYAGPVPALGTKTATMIYRGM